MITSIIAALATMMSSAQLVESVAIASPAKPVCDDEIPASATHIPKLDSPLFHETKTSLNYWIVESDQGKLEDTSDGEIQAEDLVRIEHTANCTSNHQGEHLMQFCDAARDGDGIQLNLSGGMPTYFGFLSITIDQNLAFRCDFSAIYPEPPATLRWRITKKELRLKKRDFTPGNRMHGWISVTFEEINGTTPPKTYQIEGYIKPVIQHKPE